MSARLLVFFLCLTCTAALAAQTPLAGCGTTGRSAFIDAYQSGRIKPVEKSLDTRYVPIHLTLVGDDNGAGYADPLVVLQSFELLNEDFGKIDVRFYIDNDIDYLNSTFYYDHDFDGGFDLMSNYNRDDVVNSYFVGNPNGACGYYSGRGDGIALGINCISPGDRTWSHEVGHYFGLPHTFFGWESKEKISNINAFDKPAPERLTYAGRSVPVEKVDRSNCAEAADGFCDTPADYLPERWRCNALGVYPDSLLDPDSIRFAVSAQNIMSYAFDGCVESFSPEQVTAMNTNLNRERFGLAGPAPESITPARGEDVVLLSPAQNETAAFSNRVTLKWNSVENADFYLVQINISSNFNGQVYTSFFTSDTTALVRDILQPNTRYYWRVRPVNRYDVSGTFSDFQRFRNGAEISTATRMDATLDAGVVVAPNPVAGDQSITVTGTDVGAGELHVQLLDVAGRVLTELPRRRVSGSFTAEVSARNLQPGLYLLRLALDGRQVTKKVVVASGY